MSRRRSATSIAQLRLLDAAEVLPASSLCQRWSHGVHSWRRRRDGGFDRRLYAAHRIEKAVAKAFVERHHYLHSFVAERLSWGLYQGDELVGVAVFGVPSHEAVLTNVFPDLVPSLNQGMASTHLYYKPFRRPVGVLPPPHRPTGPVVTTSTT